MPWGLTPAHLIIILVIVLIVVGPGKLPDTGAAIGKALRGFKDAMETGEAHPNATQQAAPPPVPGQPLAPYQQQSPQYPPQYPVNQPPQYPPQYPVNQPPQYPAQPPQYQAPQYPVSQPPQYPAQPPLPPTGQPPAPQGEPPRQG
jgi:TatA/E family protein of Tat protein translocase